MRNYCIYIIVYTCYNDYIETKGYKMKRLGVVIYFDTIKGDGEVLDLGTGKHLYVHYSAINSELPFKNLNKDDFVEFSIYRNLYMMQIDYIKKLEPDFDYLKVNICLEFLFRRGVDFSERFVSYDI